MITAPTSPLVESLDAQGLALAKAEPGDTNAPALRRARASAHDAARALGVPTTRLERWKYTNLRALGARRFDAPGALPSIEASLVANVPTPRLVMANGRHVPELSDLGKLSEGVRVRLLSGVLRDAPDEAAEWLETDLSRRDAAFQQWNGALADEGLVLEVEAGVRVAQPLHLVVLGVEDGAERAFHLRHRLVLGAGSALTLAVHQLGVRAHRHLLNTVQQVELGEGAVLTETRLQHEADGATLVQRTQATLAANAHYRRLDLELGGALSRHELDVILAGDGAQLDANGVLLADGRRHIDTRLGIEHRGRDTRCELMWRGLGAQRGRAVFHGGILIAEGADGANASLSNKNLLLDDGAEIDTQPVLVIHADDVQAAHGATVGRLDSAALFYLRARGVPVAEATAMLTAAFLREPLAVVADAGLEAMLAHALDDRLAGAAPSSIGAR